MAKKKVKALHKKRMSIKEKPVDFRKIFTILSSTLLVLGIILVLGSNIAITGQAIGAGLKATCNYIGLICMLAAIMIFSATSALESSVKESYKSSHELQTYAKDALSSKPFGDELKKLLEKLESGNTSAGLGSRHLSFGNISYVEGHNGGRVFYKRLEDGRIDIVAISSPKNKEHVMEYLREAYIPNTP